MGSSFQVVCASCGAELQPWFDLTRDDGPQDDDAAFETWRNTPCPNCGTTPRETGVRRSSTDDR
jgi:DNA-directed RNA polymerase subunit RPC12/RpoP